MKGQNTDLFLLITFYCHYNMHTVWTPKRHKQAKYMSCVLSIYETKILVLKWKNIANIIFAFHG